MPENERRTVEPGPTSRRGATRRGTPGFRDAYPRHKVVVDAFVPRGDLVGVGPFTDRSGNLAIFRSRQAAEEFAKQDPFILEGLIASYEIHEWTTTCRRSSSPARVSRGRCGARSSHPGTAAL